MTKLKIIVPVLLLFIMAAVAVAEEPSNEAKEKFNEGITAKQAGNFTEAIECTGIVLAKLDGSAKGGVVVAIRQSLGIPVKYVGVGEGIDDLQVFDVQGFVDALVAH